MSEHVFVLDPVIAGRLTVGDLIDLPDAELHHAKVRRIEAGEIVHLIDGQGRRIIAQALTAAQSSHHLDLEVVDTTDESPPPVTFRLVQALAKNGRDEQAIEMATELGVREVVPWQASRSVVQWRGSRAQKGAQRWNHIVTAAAKQSRQAWIPQLETVRSSIELAHEISRWSGADELVTVLDGGGEPWSDAYAVWQRRGSAIEIPRVVTVIVGPEGGMTPDEIQRFQAAGAQVVALGRSTMRTSSAGSAAIAALNLFFGVWR